MSTTKEDVIWLSEFVCGLCHLQNSLQLLENSCIKSHGIQSIDQK